jgi:hypothetical protein
MWLCDGRNNRFERLEWVVGQLREQQRSGCEGTIKTNEQEVSIGRRSSNLGCGDGATRAGSILHQNRLAKALAQGLGEHTGSNVY